MHEHLQDQVSISMPTGSLLVIFEYLANSYQTWRKNHASSDEATFELAKPDAGERLALWQLEGAIERILPEIFSPDYRQLLSEWKEYLVANRR